VEKRNRKSHRIQLTERQKPLREQIDGSGDVETVELKIEELEQRVTPRTIGTFF
jgi:hypothetical protein